MKKNQILGEPKRTYTYRASGEFKKLLARKSKELGMSEGAVIEACFMACHARNADLLLARKKGNVISILSQMEKALQNELG